ncbi:MAG: hypothetical protein QW390_04280 [Candidatus Bathyarchaeia archaeon]
MIGSLPRLADDLDDAIEKAVQLQLRYGVDLISDGEQRADMLGYFEQIPGFTRTRAGLAVAGKVRPMRDAADSYKVVDFMRAVEALRRMGVDSEVKISITGPVTLGFTAASGGVKHYKSIIDEDLYYDVVEALSPIACELLRRGAYVQIDEPGLAGGFMSPQRSEKALSRLVDELEASQGLQRLSIHVCGNVAKTPGLSEVLQRLRIPTLSLAFSGLDEANNLRLPLEKMLSQNGKTLGLGCVSTKAQRPSEVDSVDTIRGRVQDMERRLGPGKIRYVHPDCGLGKTHIEVAKLILGNMKEATESWDCPP